jgi:hypothetical protein
VGEGSPDRRLASLTRIMSPAFRRVAPSDADPLTARFVAGEHGSGSDGARLRQNLVEPEPRIARADYRQDDQEDPRQREYRESPRQERAHDHPDRPRHPKEGGSAAPHVGHRNSRERDGGGTIELTHRAYVGKGATLGGRGRSALSRMCFHLSIRRNPP